MQSCGTFASRLHRFVHWLPLECKLKFTVLKTMLHTQIFHPLHILSHRCRSSAGHLTVTPALRHTNDTHKAFSTPTLLVPADLYAERTCISQIRSPLSTAGLISMLNACMAVASCSARCSSAPLDSSRKPNDSITKMIVRAHTASNLAQMRALGCATMPLRHNNCR